jgi:hypothetical protein
MNRRKKTTKRKSAKKKSAKKKQLGKYKSGLELDAARILSESGLPFLYEEKEYYVMDKFRYEGVYQKMTPKAKDLRDRSNSIVLPIKYTPDFVAKDESWIIETKGYIPSHHDFPMRWKLFLKHLSETLDEMPMVFICRNKHQIEQAIKVIKNNEENKQ